MRIHFSFPSLPHLVLISIPMLYQQVDLNVSPYFPYLCSELCSSLEPLSSWLFAVRCTSKRGDFYVTFSISTACPTMHNGASLMSSDPNGLLMPSGQMVSIEVWSNPTCFNSGTNHPADEKGVRFEIRSETWSSGRIEALFAFLCFKFVCVSFAVSRSYLKQMKVLEERILFNPCRPTDQQWNHCFKTPQKKTCSAEKGFALMLSGRNITLQVDSSKRLLLSDLSAASHQTQLR